MHMQGDHQVANSQSSPNPSGNDYEQIHKLDLASHAACPTSRLANCIIAAHFANAMGKGSRHSKTKVIWRRADAVRCQRYAGFYHSKKNDRITVTSLLTHIGRLRPHLADDSLRAASREPVSGTFTFQKNVDHTCVKTKLTGMASMLEQPVRRV